MSYDSFLSLYADSAYSTLALQKVYYYFLANSLDFHLVPSYVLEFSSIRHAYNYFNIEDIEQLTVHGDVILLPGSVSRVLLILYREDDNPDR